MEMLEESKPTDDVCWKQYALLVDVFQHYLDLVLKFNVFYYAATGAFMSFYLTHGAIFAMRYALVFMAALSLGFAFFFAVASTKVRHIRSEISTMIVRLRLGVLPEMHILTLALRLTSFLLAMIGVGLLAISFRWI